MRISIIWRCRSCDKRTEAQRDTADYPARLNMVCSHPCGHSSGILDLAYTFKEEHRPNWEAEVYPDL